MAIAFTAAACPYSWHSSYGAAYNAALARFTTPAYQASHAYTAARTARVDAGMVADREVQTCSDIRTYPVDTGTRVPTQANIRVQVTETDSATRVATNTASEYFGYTLTLGATGWRISADLDGG